MHTRIYTYADCTDVFDEVWDLVYKQGEGSKTHFIPSMGLVLERSGEDYCLMYNPYKDGDGKEYDTAGEFLEAVKNIFLGSETTPDTDSIGDTGPVDMSTLCVGDRIVTLGGHTLLVTDVECDGDTDYPYDVHFSNDIDKSFNSYTAHGTVWKYRNDDYDIIQIIKDLPVAEETTEEPVENPTVDMSKLHIGDTIQMSNETSAKVTAVTYDGYSTYPYRVEFILDDGDSDWETYTSEGKVLMNEAHENDIVKIVSANLVTDPVTESAGLKYDGGKLLFRPLMRGLALPLRAVAAVLSYGAQKYKEDSWQTVPDAKRRYEDAYYRHMNAREAGEVYDPESGLPHRAHELCNLMFLLWFDITDGTVQNITEFKKPPSR